MRGPPLQTGGRPRDAHTVTQSRICADAHLWLTGYLALQRKRAAPVFVTGWKPRESLSAPVAEMTSAFVCASLGIVPTVRHADYLGSWLEVLREDDRAIVRAASAASKAADYLMSFRPDRVDSVEANAMTYERDAA